MLSSPNAPETTTDAASRAANMTTLCADLELMPRFSSSRRESVASDVNLRIGLILVLNEDQCRTLYGLMATIACLGTIRAEDVSAALAFQKVVSIYVDALAKASTPKPTPQRRDETAHPKIIDADFFETLRNEIETDDLVEFLVLSPERTQALCRLLSRIVSSGEILPEDVLDAQNLLVQSFLDQQGPPDSEQ